MNECILLLGSNLGDKKNMLIQAITLIESRIGLITSQSKFLDNEAVEFDSAHTFINVAIKIKTDFSPIKLLREIKQIEKKLGREKDSSQTNGYEDRIIDIDIVTFNSIIYHTNDLQIPHIKHIKERAFSKQLIIGL